MSRKIGKRSRDIRNRDRIEETTYNNTTQKTDNNTEEHNRTQKTHKQKEEYRVGESRVVRKQLKDEKRRT